MSRSHRVFVIVPAAGHSRRMGRPKLLLPVAGAPLIRHVLEATRSGVTEQIVVVRRDDTALRTEVESCGARALVPDIDPPDMRASVQHALDDVEVRWAPTPDDAWMLVPADSGLLTSAVTENVLAAWHRRERGQILVPVCQGRRGHPTVFTWPLVPALRDIPPDQGINRLVSERSAEVLEHTLEDPVILEDMDTPDDYNRLRARREPTAPDSPSEADHS